METKTCPTCHHAEHAPNKCELDNCGESEICHRNPMARYFQSTDEQGRRRFAAYGHGFRVAPPRGGWRQ